MARVQEINEYLHEFPGYSPGKELQPDAMMDIVEYGVPAMWQHQMVVHGFDPLDHMVAEFIEFCEQMEYTETEDNTEMKSKADLKNGQNGAKLHAKSSAEAQSKKKKCRADEEEEEPFCEYHQVYGHSTGECKVVLTQAKKMRANGEAKKGYGYNHYKKSENTKLKEELHAMVENMVGHALKKSKAGKKCKSDEENFNIEEFKNMTLLSEEESDDE